MVGDGGGALLIGACPGVGHPGYTGPGFLEAGLENGLDGPEGGLECCGEVDGGIPG